MSGKGTERGSFLIKEQAESEPRSVSIWLFPGQGTQEKSMGYELFQQDEDVRKIYETANSIIPGIAEISFFDLFGKLNETRVAQPAIVTYNHAYFTFLRKTNKDFASSPLFVAGNSLGEYNALIAAGALTFKEALILVRARAEGMQAACEAIKSGLIYTILKEKSQMSQIEKIVKHTGLYICLINSEEQIILGGREEQLATASALLNASKIKNGKIDVVGAFHSPLMEPAVKYIKEVLGDVELKPGQIPIIANSTARPIRTPEEIREELLKQITHPVLWADSMKYAEARGVKKFLEAGKKGILTKMYKERGVLEAIPVQIGVGAALVGAVAGAIVIGWKLTHHDHKE